MLENHSYDCFASEIGKNLSKTRSFSLEECGILHFCITSPLFFGGGALLCECFCIIPMHWKDIKIKNCSRNIETFPHITISRLCPWCVPGEASLSCAAVSPFIWWDPTLFLSALLYLFYIFSSSIGIDRGKEIYLYIYIKEPQESLVDPQIV